jgi:hypothetical protein
MSKRRLEEDIEEEEEEEIDVLAGTPPPRPKRARIDRPTKEKKPLPPLLPPRPPPVQSATHPLDFVRDPFTGAPTQTAVLLTYVRDSGLYNMYFQFRDACEAAMAVGALLGQQLDTTAWFGVPLLFWWSEALKDPTYNTVVTAAASALPGGYSYCAAMRARGGSPRTQLDSKAIIREALEEARRWAIIADHNEAEITVGAQLLVAIRELAPNPAPAPRLADYFLQ